MLTLSNMADFNSLTPLHSSNDYGYLSLERNDGRSSDLKGLRPDRVTYRMFYLARGARANSWRKSIVHTVHGFDSRRHFVFIFMPSRPFYLLGRTVRCFPLELLVGILSAYIFLGGSTVYVFTTPICCHSWLLVVECSVAVVENLFSTCLPLENIEHTSSSCCITLASDDSTIYFRDTITTTRRR